MHCLLDTPNETTEPCHRKPGKAREANLGEKQGKEGVDDENVKIDPENIFWDVWSACNTYKKNLEALAVPVAAWKRCQLSFCMWEVVGVEGERRVAGDVHDGGSGLERKYDTSLG
jgi:hypothetical protein